MKFLLKYIFSDFFKQNHSLNYNIKTQNNSYLETNNEIIIFSLLFKIENHENDFCKGKFCNINDYAMQTNFFHSICLFSYLLKI